MQKQTKLLDNGLIWFGAAVSIAEIMTGTYFAPLGFKNGLIAIVLGHFIGCILLYLAGFIGGRERKSAMETVKYCFGKKGGLLFAVLNVLQLVGWTAIMIYDGAISIGEIFGTERWIWCLVIGALIVLWISIGIENLGKVNAVAITGLFILSVILSFRIFGSGEVISSTGTDKISFGAAVELAVAMPVSWLPLISDYTRAAEKPKEATAVSVVTYGIVSTWMYMIGMVISIVTDESNIAQIMVIMGLGVVALLVIIFSTVTTTFMDALSAGISMESVSNRTNGKKIAVIVTAVGTFLAVIYPMDNITDFLYLIGSVFTPMIAIQIADYYIIKRHNPNLNNAFLFGFTNWKNPKPNEQKMFDFGNLFIWLLGFIIYRFMLGLDLSLGVTFPDMIVTILLCIVNHWESLKNDDWDDD